MAAILQQLQNAATDGNIGVDDVGASVIEDRPETGLCENIFSRDDRDSGSRANFRDRLQVFGLTGFLEPVRFKLFKTFG